MSKEWRLSKDALIKDMGVPSIILGPPCTGSLSAAESAEINMRLLSVVAGIVASAAHGGGDEA